MQIVLWAQCAGRVYTGALRAQLPRPLRWRRAYPPRVPRYLTQGCIALLLSVYVHAASTRSKQSPLDVKPPNTYSLPWAAAEAWSARTSLKLASVVQVFVTGS